MIRLGGLLAPVVARLGAARPSTCDVSHDPSKLHRRLPKEMPFDERALACPGAILSRSFCRSAVICRASISMNPEPNIPMVFRELAIDWRFVGRPSSSISPFVKIPSSSLNVAKSKRCPRTKTLSTMSPPPPTLGLLWQPEQEFVSGPETRLKFLGKLSGSEGSDNGAPVPFVSGRPAPSWLVHMASNSCLP